jgi:hypothetical protein
MKAMKKPLFLWILDPSGRRLYNVSGSKKAKKQNKKQRVEAENGGIWHAVLTRLVRKASLIM